MSYLTHNRSLRHLALTLLCLCFIGSLASAEQVISQSFAGDTTPAGWLVQGTTGTAHNTAGTALTDAHFYGAAGTQNYLQLTNNTNWQRASAYYTARTFNARNFRLTARLYMGSNADGMTLSLLDASTVRTSSDLLGGYGEYQGSPRGGLQNKPTSGALGYVAGLRGFNFEFDHFNNTELSNEHTALVNVATGSHVAGTEHDFSADPTFFTNTGWEQIQLGAYDGQMTLSYNYNASSQVYANSYSFALPAEYTGYQAMFGITAATGGNSANHWVSDVILNNNGSGVSNPEPASLVLYGLMGLGLPWLRRRKAKTA
ncbi:MAG: hypothetical protein WCP21_09220 [Armatimonadota bacterium]